MSLSGLSSNKGQFSGIQFDGSTVGLRRVTERLLNDDHRSSGSMGSMTRVSKVTSVLIPKNSVEHNVRQWTNLS